MAAIFDNLADALIPTVLGLLVAITTLWFYKFLVSRVELFDIEMENASAVLVNYLAILLRQRNS